MRSVMAALDGFLKLSWNDRVLLFKILLLMVKVRIILWLMPFNRIQESFKQIKPSSERGETICKLSWSLKVIAHYFPGSKCLINALTGYLLLSEHGYDSLVKIGVGKSAEGEFEAHAWLEYKDRVVIGESEKEYVPLFDFKH